MKLSDMDITYKECIDLGFIREDIKDPVFFDKYGFSYFVLSYEVSKCNLGFEWDVINHTMDLFFLDTGDIIMKNISKEFVINFIKNINHE